MSDAFTRPYAPSIYAKEELPVWSEIWEQFMMNEAFTYDPNDPTHNTGLIKSSKPVDILNGMDLYYQIPHRKLLLGWMANELNKLTYEDGRLDEIVDELSNIIHPFGNGKLVRMSFILVPISQLNIVLVQLPELMRDSRTISIPVPVYTQISPVTKTRSIFASTAPSIDMATFERPIQLAISTVSMVDQSLDSRIILPTTDYEMYKAILAKFLEPIELYFQPPVGWKDADYVQEPLTNRCKNAGIDPSL